MEFSCRFRGNDDTWFYVPEDTTQFDQLSLLRVDRDDGTIPMIVHVPLLKDKELYAEWLDRVQRFIGGDHNIPYVRYEVLESIDHAWNNIYLTDNEVNYEHDDYIERWGTDKKGKFTYTIFEKESHGIVMNMAAEESDTKLHPYLFEQGDLYEHPGNKSIHSLGVLLPSPHEAYVGDSLYYNPKCEDRILVRWNDTWLWTSLWEFEYRTPSHLQDEFNLMKEMAEVARKKTKWEERFNELMNKI